MTNLKIQKPRMGKNVFHPSLHLFTSWWLADQVTNSTRAIKKFIFGDENADTYYEGPSGCAQMALQTEFTLSEFSSHSKVSDALDLLDQRLDAIFAEGVAVHLLLPVHDLPATNWMGIDWVALKNQWPGAVFDPYQPFLDEFSNKQQCAYDIISENFHKIIIEHLVESGRVENLSVIYLMNEFGYPSNEILDSAKNWNDDTDWMNIRAEALKNTAERILNNGRVFANGSVPVGLKFATMTSVNTGWTPFSDDSSDQLALILNIMSKKKDIFAYDMYFTDNNYYDETDRERLKPFFSLFEPGFFEISESSKICSGEPDQFLKGSRPSSKNILEACEIWNEAQGFNLFAWNVCGPDQGCYAIADDSTNIPFEDAYDEGAGLWALFERAISN